MAAVALPEVRGADPLVSEHPDPELVRTAGTMRQLPPADLYPLSARGAVGRNRFIAVVAFGEIE